jgi:RNA polymerase sigma-70 factor (ECF subfamily)
MRSDYELLKRSLKKDRKVQTEIYETYFRRVFSSCLRIVKDVHHAEDFTQEAFVHAFERIESFRGEAELGTWICRIAINKCLDHLKKRKVRLEFDQHWENKSTEKTEQTDDTVPYDVKRILMAMEELPDGCRVVFALHMFEEMDHETIAKRLGIKEASARAQYARAKNKIKELVNETYV